MVYNMSSPTVALQQARKPYTITKQRERWTEEEHAKFLEALKLHGRAWRRIEEFIGTKTAVQIRSHAQKFFTKVEREQASGLGSEIEVPPPRPKRKPTHPYPRKSRSGDAHENEFLVPPPPPATPPSVECSAASPGRPSSTTTTSLKLFGTTVHVTRDVSDDDAELNPKLGSFSLEEESGMESGVTTVNHGTRSPSPRALPLTSVQQSEVSSKELDSVATNASLSNLVTWHYANLLAGFQNKGGSAVAFGAEQQAGNITPWQLLDSRDDCSPSSNIVRWRSMDSSTEGDEGVQKVRSVKRSSSDLAAEIVSLRKMEAKRLCRQGSTSSSSSVTSSSIRDEEFGNDVSCYNLSTSLTLERRDDDPRIGGFMRYKKPQVH